MTSTTARTERIECLKERSITGYLPWKELCVDTDENANIPPNVALVTSSFVATAFATAFTIIDPVGMIPLTVSVTADATPERRGKIVDQAVLVAAAVILIMGLVGKPILDSLGITLPAFTIAGGALLFLISVDMLFGRKPGTKQTPEEERQGAESTNPAVFPLAVPMLDRRTRTDRDGARARDLGRRRPLKTRRRRRRLRERHGGDVALHAPLSQLLRLIGTTGIHVITRLFGILLSALAVQFVLNGLAATPLMHH